MTKNKSITIETKITKADSSGYVEFARCGGIGGGWIQFDEGQAQKLGALLGANVEIRVRLLSERPSDDQNQD